MSTASLLVRRETGSAAQRRAGYAEAVARAILDWQGRVLHGNMLLGARLSLKSTSDYQVWVPVSLKGGADDVSTTERILLPATTLIDLETRFEIGRFGLYWNVLNLGDKRIVPTAGWKALGIQSGFGIHWALSG